MITTIQINKNELESAQPLIKKFNAITYFNESRDNGFLRFKDLLNIEVDNYRLHLEGNVEIADDLEKYLPNILNFMQTNSIFLLSLSSPAIKLITMEYFLGKRIIDNTRIGFTPLNNIGVIYSKKFLNILKDNISEMPETTSEIVYIRDVLKKTRILSFVHLPILIQSKQHQNNLFQFDFIANNVK